MTTFPLQQPVTINGRTFNNIQAGMSFIVENGTYDGVVKITVSKCANVKRSSCWGAYTEPKVFFEVEGENGYQDSCVINPVSFRKYYIDRRTL